MKNIEFFFPVAVALNKFTKSDRYSKSFRVENEDGIQQNYNENGTLPFGVKFDHCLSEIKFSGSVGLNGLNWKHVNNRKHILNI